MEHFLTRDGFAVMFCTIVICASILLHQHKQLELDEQVHQNKMARLKLLLQHDEYRLKTERLHSEGIEAAERLGEMVQQFNGDFFPHEEENEELPL